MENKKVIIAIIIVLILIIGIVGVTFIFGNFNKKQTKLLTEESNKILQSDISKDNIDFNIKTQKNYAIVEKSIKEYISELKNIYVEMEELNSGINPNNIFTAQNMQEKDLKEVENIIKEYREKSQNCISELEEMLTEEQANSAKYSVFRGGGFNVLGSSFPISYRYSSSAENDGANVSIGFRVVLYIR